MLQRYNLAIILIANHPLIHFHFLLIKQRRGADADFSASTMSARGSIQTFTKINRWIVFQLNRYLFIIECLVKNSVATG